MAGDTLQEMGLSNTRGAMEAQRAVGLSGMLEHRGGGGICHPGARPDHKVIEEKTVDSLLDASGAWRLGGRGFGRAFERKGYIFFAELASDAVKELTIFCLNPFCAKGALGGKNEAAGGVVAARRAGEPGLEVFWP